MKKLKIIQTPARFYPYVGGVEKYVFGLSHELVKMGHIVKVICADEPKSQIKEVEGINILKLPYMGKIANTNITLSLPFFLLKKNLTLFILTCQLHGVWIFLFLSQNLRGKK